MVRVLRGNTSNLFREGRSTVGREGGLKLGNTCWYIFSGQRQGQHSRSGEGKGPETPRVGIEGLGETRSVRKEPG